MADGRRHVGKFEEELIMRKKIFEDDGSSVGEYDVPLFGGKPMRKSRKIYMTEEQIRKIFERERRGCC